MTTTMATITNSMIVRSRERAAAVTALKALPTTVP
jgi:hypothetical protein